MIWIRQLDRIRQAIEQGRIDFVYGDYDADGMTLGFDCQGEFRTIRGRVSGISPKSLYGRLCPNAASLQIFHRATGCVF